MKRGRHLALILAGVGLMDPLAIAQSDPADEQAPSSSLLARAVNGRRDRAADGVSAEATSLFHVRAAEPREFRKHDLVQIIVRESSTAKSSHELETEKDYQVGGEVRAFPRLSLESLLQLQMYAGRTVGLPELDVQFSKEFEGEGEYKRRDDLTARLSAEVIEVLPNGNLVLEARTEIRTDEEYSVIKVTGLCRPEDVTAANTVLSNQVHNLRIVKEHTGELKKANEKGLIARVLDFVFAW